MIKLEYGKEILKGRKIKFIFKCIYFIFIGICFMALNKASILDKNFTPFAFSLLFALFWTGLNPYILSLIYLFCGVLSNLSETGFYLALVPALVVFLAGFIHKRIKKAPKIYLTYIYAGLSQSLFLLFNLYDLKSFVFAIIAVILGLIMLYIMVSFLKATVKREFNTKLNLDEKICGAIIVIVISMGLSKLNFYGFETLKIIVTIMILISTYLFNNSCTLLIGALLGVGYAVTSLNPIYIGAFVCYALLSLAFKTSYKVLSIIGILIAEILFGLYFNEYEIFGIFSLASILIGGIIFLLLPKKLMDKVGDFLGGIQEKSAVRNIVNRNRDNVCKRLNEIAGIFNEMTYAYKSMVKGRLSKNETLEYLTSELTQRVCKNCLECNKCLRVNGEYTTKILGEVALSGLEKGKVTLLDISQYLSSRCVKINTLINEFNSILADYRASVIHDQNLDTSKILIAEQLNGVSGLLKTLVGEIKTNIAFDLHSENKIIEELAYKNIACIEAVVFEENLQEKNVSLLLKNINLNEKVIEKIVSKVCHSKMAVTGVVPSELPNVSIVSLKTKPNFDIVFGSASISKQDGANGDTHSVIRLNNGKYLLAVCDGMGNGIKAKQTSELSISLIENFYKAGFDNDTILKSVNKLLALSNKEEFSALDLCVLDLRKNICDVIKLGTPSTFIKHKNSVTEIESSYLPIGILEDFKPKITKTYLSEFDTIIMISDGITEAFRGTYDLKTIINNITSINPQTIADEIMAYAKRISPSIPDDMTVLVARVYPVV